MKMLPQRQEVLLEIQNKKEALRQELRWRRHSEMVKEEEGDFLQRLQTDRQPVTRKPQLMADLLDSGDSNEASRQYCKQIKQRRAWLLFGWVTAERFCPCKQPACPAIGEGSEVILKPLVSRLSVREGSLALSSPETTQHPSKFSWESVPHVYMGVLVEEQSSQIMVIGEEHRVNEDSGDSIEAVPLRFISMADGHSNQYHNCYLSSKTFPWNFSDY
ncbi:hypothetical protein J6590_064026 [Homalodisca vitripennis]|nr:hypothetical protein J6590_064026 [Homalodisca vitripennis]